MTKIYQRVYTIDWDEVESLEDVKDILKSLDIIYAIDEPCVGEIEHLLRLGMIEIEEPAIN